MCLGFHGGHHRRCNVPPTKAKITLIDDCSCYERKAYIFYVDEIFIGCGIGQTLRIAAATASTTHPIIVTGVPCNCDDIQTRVSVVEATMQIGQSSKSPQGSGMFLFYF